MKLAIEAVNSNDMNPQVPRQTLVDCINGKHGKEGADRRTSSCKLLFIYG